MPLINCMFKLLLRPWLGVSYHLLLWRLPSIAKHLLQPAPTYRPRNEAGDHMAVETAESAVKVSCSAAKFMQLLVIDVYAASVITPVQYISTSFFLVCTGRLLLRLPFCLPRTNPPWLLEFCNLSTCCWHRCLCCTGPLFAVKVFAMKLNR